jgi:hypothetical protein
MNNCRPALAEITQRHIDIVEIVAQHLKRFKNQIVDLDDKDKRKKFKTKLGWNSTVKLPYHTEQEIPEEFEEESKRKPDIWFYKLEDRTKNKEKQKVLSLNLVEVTVPFGYAQAEFFKTPNDEIDEAKKPNIIVNSLSKALQRKSQKYFTINRFAQHLIDTKNDKLLNMFHVSDV